MAVYDVHIIGGGPSGCLAGISACMGGANALISEEHNRVGHPVACSGLVSKSGLESLMPYVDFRKAVLNEINSARFVCRGEEFVVTPKRERAVLISRGEFDAFCAERFVSEGGRLNLGEKVTRGFKSKNIIGADGPASAVADFFGFPKISSFVSCAQGVFKFPSENPHQVSIFLSKETAPGFFGWAIPINEEKAEIGLGVRASGHPLSYFKRFLSELHVQSEPESKFCAVIPISLRGKTSLCRGAYNVILSGDAAGQVKATTGGGVFFGSHCGLAAGRNYSDALLYESEWRGKCLNDLLMHHALRNFLNIWGGAPHPMFFSLAKSLFIEDILSSEGRMDRLSDMVSPSFFIEYGKIAARKLIQANGAK